MTIQTPYVIWGVVKNQGEVQVGATVTVRNDTKGEESNFTTQMGGIYAANLGDKSKFTTDYADSDSIKVTYSGVTHETTVDISGSPGSRQMDFTLLSVSDNGEGSEAIAMDKPVSVEESSTSLDILSFLKSIPVSESLVGVDSVGFAKQIVMIDTSSGLSAISLDKSISFIELAEGADSILRVITVGAVNIYENVVGVDAVPFPNTMIVTIDACGSVESIDLIIINFVNADDAGVGTDAISFEALLAPIVDFGTGSDVMVLLKPVSVSDAGGGISSIDVVPTGQFIQDAGSGVDGITLVAEASVVSDTAQGLDIITFLKQILQTELSLGVDSVNVLSLTTKVVDDVGSAADIITAAGSIQVLDSVVGSEVVTIWGIGETVVIDDVGSGVGAISVISGSLVNISDAGLGADIVAAIPLTYVISDSGAGADEVSMDLSRLIADAAASLDIILINKGGAISLIVTKVTDKGMKSTMREKDSWVAVFNG